MSLALPSHQLDALVSLRQMLEERRCVLIGAAALTAQIPMSRETKDVDLAVVLPVADLAGLLVAAGWTRDPGAAQRWYWTNGAAADFIPATAELIARGELHFEGEEKSMSLVGFDLALEHTVRERLPGTETEIEVATLPVLVVLKIVAWLDRPSERGKDLGDLACVFEKALSHDDPRRWEGAVYDSGLEDEDLAAFFAGLEVARIARPAHRLAIESFLSKVEPELDGFAQMLHEARYPARDPDDVLRRRLAAFRRGLGSR